MSSTSFTWSILEYVALFNFFEKETNRGVSIAF